ncbi:MAG: nucleoside deaminase [Geminicoccaceae bacterium]|nr:MAG: nucleoside deaminase [Geminicoccaceae bacterium]
MDDAAWMQRAIDLATANVAQGGGPFGALVVKNGHIVATGTNRVTAGLDPTAHAEIQAIRQACQALESFALEGCTLYSSCEPCPMCLAAAHWARLERIVFAADRFDAAAANFDDALLYDELTRPLTARRTPIHHLPLPTARTPFEAWQALATKTPY